ncbi:MAG TPA: lysylphosphatidylglycerol synthase domain-containing protein [Streptosporangiaceae bacterium]|nr:lysylphosphatidylglycerol synthase domain-containing protein [Streptosporangiaceae bacterium]
MAALTHAASGAAEPEGATQLRVDDHLEPRVRIPADLVRCVIALTEIAILIGLALLASATAQGVAIDVVGASKFASEQFPGALLSFLSFSANLAFLILPAILAVRLGMIRQFRRLAEAIIAGGATAGVVALANLLLDQRVRNLMRMCGPHSTSVACLLDRLRVALHSTSATATLDGYLAALIAFVTVIGLGGRPHWRTAFWTAIGFYAVVALANHDTTILALLITVLIGSAIGAGLRYAMGTMSGRPTAIEIAAALTSPGAPIIAMRRLGNGGAEVRRYAATIRGGDRLDVTVFDRDQQAADTFYRLYRRLRLKTHVSRSAPLTLEGAIERQALLSYATEDAGVRTPRLHAVVRVGPDAAALATEHVRGQTLAELGAPTDAQLRRVWDTVLRLHQHRITHRALTADRILFAADSDTAGDTAGDAAGEVVLLEPGNGDVAATDLQFRLDLTQLIAETALLVGPDRAASLAVEKVANAELSALVPLLQPVALYRSTRAALRRRKDILAELRRRLLSAAPDGHVEPVQLERIRPRTLITLIAGIFAAYLLAGQLADVSFGTLLAHVNPGWALAALALSAGTYFGATLALSGFVLERLNMVRTLLVQVAGSFVILVTPAAVGGVALNLRYLRRSRLSPADAAASVGVTQVISFLVYIVLLLIFAAIAGTSHTQIVHVPGWAYIALAVVAGLVLILLALPAGRRQLIARLASVAGQVIPRLLDVAQRPAKLAQGIGGALLLTMTYVLCLAASVRALGVLTVPIASLGVVYLTSSALGSVVPTPGGLGAVEAAMSAGLTAAGLPGAKAVAAVLLFRTVTFWLPVPAGWLAMRFLQRRDVL